jgi:hypothetical protein
MFMNKLNINLMFSIGFFCLSLKRLTSAGMRGKRSTNFRAKRKI